MSVHFSILRCLTGGRSHGYALQQRLTTLRDFYPLRNVNVYPVLNELEARGLATSTTEIAGHRARRVYEITGRGREALHEWLTTRSDQEALPEVRDPAHLRLVLATNETRDVAWVAPLIDDVISARDRAERQYEKSRDTLSPLARLAVEELLANLERRQHFLERVRDLGQTLEDDADDPVVAA